MNIIDPSLQEKNRAIEHILSQGLSKPRSLWHYIRELYRVLGLRYIFMGSGSAMVMTAAFILIWLRLLPFTPEHHPYAALFAFSPIFFLATVCMTEAIERVGGLYALKMTCKYTIQQITAFRVLCFSLLGVLFCTLTSLRFSRLPVDYSVFKALPLSLCALFLCAALTLIVSRLYNRVWVYVLAILVWMAASMVPIWVFGEAWELFLARIPVAFTLLVTFIACAWFLAEIKRNMKFHIREVVHYAGR